MSKVSLKAVKSVDVPGAVLACALAAEEEELLSVCRAIGTASPTGF